MAINVLVPTNWRRRRTNEAEGLPYVSLQQQMNRVFDDFFSGWGEPARWSNQSSTFSPKINFSEQETEYLLEAELPGIDEKDMEISLSNEGLTIKGERKDRTEHKEGAQRYIEQSYGMFERFIPLTSEIEHDKVDSTFKNGILTVRLPKSTTSQDRVRKLKIRTA